MMTDSPEGQTQSYSQEEERRVLQERLEYYLRQLAPHQKEREAAQLLVALQFALTFKTEQVRKLERSESFYKDELQQTHDYHDAAMIAIAKTLGKDVTEVPRFKWVDLHANHVVQQLAQANETIAALQARIEAADKQEPVLWVDLINIAAAERSGGGVVLCGLEQYDDDYLPLFASPPITSERELALLAVIEQKDDVEAQNGAFVQTN